MYALWLMPDETNSKMLSKIIRHFSEKYQSPLFEPHITLLGKIIGDEAELIKSVKTLADNMSCINVSSCLLGTENTYYKRLFLKIGQSEMLDQANQQANKLFELKAEYRWLPHLSLLYTEQVIGDKDLTSLGEFDLKLNRLQLISASGLPKDWKVLISTDLRK